MKLLQDRVATPLGTVLVVSDGESLRALDFEDFEARMHKLLARHYGEVELLPGRNPGGARHALDAYFAGDFHALDRFPVATNGTAFQQLIWRELRAISAGTTSTYGELATRIGNPAASRAVGLANGANPIAIAVPCHRMLGANGNLTGYAGGLTRKRWLLRHEGAFVD
ncbi:MAG: methylated-DNA--[protein]-cysteine S-methyltransferase [Gammaproteobacteria bacterium]|mgnify:CR=1 FL=1|nr:methylated-DNA--[protein]-cysteine S-methyltransferase [Gammaproteobacteria bacterium]